MARTIFSFFPLFVFTLYISTSQTHPLNQSETSPFFKTLSENFASKYKESYKWAQQLESISTLIQDLDRNLNRTEFSIILTELQPILSHTLDSEVLEEERISRAGKIVFQRVMERLNASESRENKMLEKIDFLTVQQTDVAKVVSGFKPEFVYANEETKESISSLRQSIEELKNPVIEQKLRNERSHESGKIEDQIFTNGGVENGTSNVIQHLSHSAEMEDLSNVHHHGNYGGSHNHNNHDNHDNHHNHPTTTTTTDIATPTTTTAGELLTSIAPLITEIPTTTTTKIPTTTTTTMKTNSCTSDHGGLTIVFSDTGHTGISEHIRFTFAEPGFLSTSGRCCKNTSRIVNSINTYGGCVVLFDERGCGGNGHTFRPGMGDHWNAGKGKEELKSISPC